MAAVPMSSVLRVVELGRQRFLYGLECVPEERLSWSAGEGSHTPLELAGRLASFVEYRARVLTNTTGAPVARAAPAVPASREAARELLDAAFGGLSAAVEGLSQEDLDRPVTAPWGAQVPAGVLLLTALNVVGYFQGQLNYCQLAYGDGDPNIPPEWRPATG